MSEAVNSLIQATVDHLGQFAPFDQMAREHLLWMAQKLTLGYFAKGEVILSPEQPGPVQFFIIKQGVVQGEQGSAPMTNGAAWLELHEGECFPLGALLANRPVTSVYRASSDVFCYLLPAADFLQLTRLSEPFYDFCTRRIANLLDHSLHLIHAGYSKASAEQQSMSSRLAAIIRREPVIGRRQVADEHRPAIANEARQLLHRPRRAEDGGDADRGVQMVAGGTFRRVGRRWFAGGMARLAGRHRKVGK